jgi:hypothetical protein
MVRANWFLALLLVGLMGAVGCDSQIKVVPAGGIVTLDGEPLEGASVAFSPVGDEGHIATAKTDESGRFTLNTPGVGEGAAAGSYQVTVSKLVGTGEVELLDEDPRAMGGEMSPEQMSKMMEMMQPGRQPVYKPEVPRIYGVPDQSGLTAEVTDGGDNNFTFELKR